MVGVQVHLALGPLHVRRMSHVSVALTPALGIRPDPAAREESFEQYVNRRPHSCFFTTSRVVHRSLLPLSPSFLLVFVAEYC
jgi:hypothetical protein